MNLTNQQCENIKKNNLQNKKVTGTDGGPCADAVGWALSAVTGRKIKKGCLPSYVSLNNYEIICTFERFKKLPAGTVLRIWEADHFIHTALLLNENMIWGKNGGDLLYQPLTTIYPMDFIHSHFAYRCLHYYVSLLYVTAKDLFMTLKAINSYSSQKEKEQLDHDSILLSKKYNIAKLQWQNAKVRGILIPENNLYKKGIDELCSAIDALEKNISTINVNNVLGIIQLYEMDKLQEQYWDYFYRKVPFFKIDLYALDNEFIFL